ncbi:mannitol dehydrogenase family protein [Frigidibacter sp. ROC022]|uniref:mannitol dehydrogenase family protein n=1 Tax=Frigidibacter sp. ROC022 TaxID=2971796 RepID=UPI00215B5BF3|nr:mannitol dehydrogenase family protein [Frigidibacter sp. ROC022]MCR8723764.1 mannitol dehydrogenase family protein [Frigidibacter sp. ROC022]
MTTPRLTRQPGQRPGTGIVHLGLGAFFRAHGAIYIAEAMAAHPGDWGILGVSLKSPGTRDALQPQGWDYTAVEQGPDGEIPRVVNVLNGVLVAPEDPGAVLAAMADPAVKIVSLTVTEKGYCHEPATGELDFDHVDIIHDMEHEMPRSAPGYLVRALAMRRRAGLKPFTVMTCDNLPENGKVVRKVVLSLARVIDPGLADWIETRGAFPSTMVDRIVPATKPEDIARLAKATGRLDEAPVMHEPFRQWVIEDDFVDGRPDFSAVGVQMVRDVTPYEHMKLRMLNGTHSSLAYLGYLAGHETIADTVADPVFAAYVQHLWQREIIPALTPPPGESLTAYAEALLARYRNPAIRHRTWQIAMDGSQKLPQRLLGTLRENAAAGRDSAGLLLAVAGWMRYVGGVDEKGQPIEVKDPLAARLRALSDSAETPEGKVAALLGVTEIFSPDQAAGLKPGVTAAYRSLLELGSRGAAQKIAG